MADQATETPVVEIPVAAEPTPAPPVVAPEIPAGAVPLTMQQIMELLAYQNQLSQDNMLKMVQEMKKPTEEEQRKVDEQKNKDLRFAKARAEVGEAEAERRVARQRNCAHKRPDQSWAASGQQLTGNEYMGKVYDCERLAIIFCLQCQKSLYIGPSSPMFAQGVPYNVNLKNVQ